MYTQSLHRRLLRLEKTLAQLPVELHDDGSQPRRLRQVDRRLACQLGEARVHLSAENQQCLLHAWEQLNTGNGPLYPWLVDLLTGRSRLPSLSGDIMAQVLSAWLSPQAESIFAVCLGCGLEWPRRHVVWAFWPMTPQQQMQPATWWRQQDFFVACPCCGGTAQEWAHLQAGPRSWRQLDGYAGPASLAS